MVSPTELLFEFGDSVAGGSLVASGFPSESTDSATERLEEFGKSFADGSVTDDEDGLALEDSGLGPQLGVRPGFGVEGRGEAAVVGENEGKGVLGTRGVIDAARVGECGFRFFEVPEDFGGVVAGVSGTCDVHPLFGCAVQEVFDGRLAEENLGFLGAWIAGSGGEVINSAGVDNEVVGGDFFA